jgi:hypothetical protein
VRAVISAASWSMMGPSLSVVHTLASWRRKLAPTLSSPPTRPPSPVHAQSSRPGRLPRSGTSTLTSFIFRCFEHLCVLHRELPETADAGDCQPLSRPYLGFLDALVSRDSGTKEGVISAESAFAGARPSVGKVRPHSRADLDQVGRVWSELFEQRRISELVVEDLHSVADDHITESSTSSPIMSASARGPVG